MRFLLSFLALATFGYAALTTVIIVQTSDANKAQQRALVCFDDTGRPTIGDHWKECRVVAVREL
jgi:hypothetical protein